VVTPRLGLLWARAKFALPISDRAMTPRTLFMVFSGRRPESACDCDRQPRRLKVFLGDTVHIDLDEVVLSIVRTCSPRGIHWYYAIIRAAGVRECGRQACAKNRSKIASIGQLD